jgi:hypothetical protein
MKDDAQPRLDSLIDRQINNPDHLGLCAGFVTVAACSGNTRGHSPMSWRILMK